MTLHKAKNSRPQYVHTITQQDKSH